MGIYSKLFLTFSISCFILALSGCCEPQKYEFTNIKISDTVDKKTQKVTNPRTTLPADSKIIYGQANFKNPSTDNAIYVQIDVSREVGGQKIPAASSQVKTKTSGTIVFQSKRPGFNWPTGDYVIDFKIDEVIYATYKFKITGSFCDKNIADWVQAVETAKQVDSAHNPIDPTDIFSASDSNIYLTFAASSKIPANTTIKVDWAYTQNYKFLSSASSTINPGQKIHFTFDKEHHKTHLLNNGNWPNGGYQATITIGEECKQVVRFEVE